MKLFFIVLLLVFSSKYTHADIFKCKPKESNSEVSITEIQRLAERGVPMAQCLLGLSYKLGDYELVKDEVKGIYWITKAAAQGYVPAQECLAGYYRDEKTDYKKSWHWALEAAQRGSGETMRILATYAIQGQGCDKDLCECIKWLLLSASAGDQASQEWLSELDYRLNIYETLDFFDGYILAERWLEIYKIKDFRINHSYEKKYIYLLNKYNE